MDEREEAARVEAAQDIEYAAGRFSVAGTDLGIGLFGSHARPAQTRIPPEPTTDGARLANACHVCEIDRSAHGGMVIVPMRVQHIGRVIAGHRPRQERARGAGLARRCGGGALRARERQCCRQLHGLARRTTRLHLPDEFDT